jgi:dipeptidyl aminopeptidase/acylaminoacyl peptidase
MQSTVWVHDSRGDRPVSGEGFASLPGLGATNHPWADSVFSADGKRLFYLLGQRVPRQFGSGQLWVADLDSGRTEAVIPGVLVTEFDIAPDGQRVTFETQDENGARNAWLAPLDRSSPPQRLAGSVALMPHFAADGNVYMFVPEGGQRFLYKVGADRIARKLGPISGNFIGLSPRGDWLIEGYDPVTARPVRGGVSIPVCRCSLAWGPDSKFLYLRFQDYGGLGGGRTIAIGLPPDKELPVLPPSGLKSAKDVKGLKVVGDIDMTGLGYFVPGPNPSIYAYTKVTVLRNLFRIPID